MLKIIHFITDEKFLNGAISFFEDINKGNNRYIVYNNPQPFSFINSSLVERKNYNQILAIVSDKNSCDIIILHNFQSLPDSLICKIHKQIKVVWYSWGFDIYDNVFPQRKLIPLKNTVKKGTLNRYMKNLLAYHKLRLICKRCLNIVHENPFMFIKAVRRVDYYSGVFPEEYELLKKTCSFFVANETHFNYVSNNSIIKYEDVDNIPVVGDDIQIGNSALFLLNHVNAFKLLSKFNIDGRKIIVPLSYNGNEKYIEYVKKEGFRFFGQLFTPIDTFVPYNDYKKIIGNVGVLIMNIERQAGVGNISIALWNGAKVFLPQNSVSYKHYKRHGFVVFALENITLNDIVTKLTKDEILTNRKNLALLSYDRVSKGVMDELYKIKNK